MMITNNKKLPFKLRLEEAKKRCQVILNEYDVDITAILIKSPSSLSSQLLWIDKQNAQQLVELGLTPLPQSHEAKTDDEKLSN